MSVASVDPTKMELSPMRVTFDGVDLGGTKEGVTITPARSKADITTDQLGTTVQDRRVSGFNMTVAMSLAEIKTKSIWKVVFPNAKLVGTFPNQAIYFDAQIGVSDLSHAKQLLLHPLSLSDADLDGDYLIYKAVANEESEIVYNAENQSALKIIWNVYPDTSVSPARFLTIGDPAIGVVNATADAAVANGGNTGDGTVSAPVADNAGSQTETITMTCVTAAVDGGIFNVDGSLTGPLGLATVGTPFVAPNNEIAFTINDGAADFIVGDSFTIAVTAANFV